MSVGSQLLRKPIYYPLDQSERASHLDVNQLLPRDIYERLAEMLQESLQQLPSASCNQQDVPDQQNQFARGRGHTAIFLDGDRGTGKTTVIVNLPAYLAATEVRGRFEGLADQVHILQPIDSSQLEDDDDLFLNVVVAAVLGDQAIQLKKENDPVRWQALYDSLQKLGRAFPALPPTIMTSAETPLRFSSSPFQAQGGASPGKGRTPSSHNRRIYAARSLTTRASRFWARSP